MITSDKGRALIKAHEGKRLVAYRCPAGVWTIGYGHTSAAGAPEVKPGMRISQIEADAILARDLEAFEKGVRSLVKGPLTQGQFDALVSFTFNVGLGALKRSTLLKRLNAGQHKAVPAELMKWTRAGGRELPGLVRRRRDEAELWRSLDPAATGGRADAGNVDVPADIANPKPLMQSRTVAGSSLAAMGGVGSIGLVIAEARTTLEQVQGQLSTGTIIGLVIGGLIVAGALLALYARWDDAGRPLPWRS
jgi:lysozyme